MNLRGPTFEARTVSQLRKMQAAFRVLFEHEPVVTCYGVFEDQQGQAVFFDFAHPLVKKVYRDYVGVKIDGELTRVKPDASMTHVRNYFRIE